MKFLLYLIRLCLSLRYRIHMQEEERARSRLHQQKGTIALVNHTSLLDPIISFAYFWPKWKIKGVVEQPVYHLSMIKPFRRWMIPLAFSKPSSREVIKIKDLEQLFARIADDLKKGKTILLAPSGCLKRSSKEYIPTNLGLQYLLEHCPNVNVVLIRITGLWGSSFSRAITGQTPPFLATLKNAVGILLKNGIFFTPKRDVFIHVDVNPSDFPHADHRLTMNQYLEGWFNQYKDRAGLFVENEPKQLVPYYFWQKKP